MKYFVFLSFCAFACNLFFYVRWYSHCENNCNGFTSSEDENAHNFRNVLDSDTYSRSVRALNESSPPLFTIVTFLREGLDNEHLQIFVRSLIAQKSVTFNVIFLDEYSSCRKVEDNKNVFVDRLLRRDKELVEGLNYNIISKGGECRATTAESLNVMKSVRGSIHKETKWILSLKPTFQFDFQDNFLSQMIDFPIRQGDSREEILRDNNFLHMNVAGMGCKIMSDNGRTLLEAGGILWNDGSLQRFGKGEKFAYDDIYTYRRPVDFSSSDCLLLEKDLYMKFAPSENIFSENDYNYRLIEAQLMAQHMEKRYIWYEARSVVRDLDVSEVKQVSYQLSDETMVHLKPILDMEHLPPPEPTNTYAHITRASDLRARSSSSANIFYMDGELPFRGLGGGYGRSFDNMAMIANMGHYVTVAAVDLYQECTEACQDALYELNIAVVRKKSYHMYLGYRIHLFDIVMVSRPTTMIRSIRWLKARYKLNAFALIYDCEALWFRRDVLLREASKAMNIDFPGKPYKVSDELQDLQEYANQQTELSMLHMPDIILAVSEGEKYFVSDYLNSQSKPSLREKSVYSIGHIVEQSLVSFDSLPKFEERSGLLFIAAFHSSMYYNGDAIWYFLKEVYPLIVKENNDIVLTIAGRGIPEELKSFVEKHEDLDDRHVSFVESPESLDDLYNSAKLFIVPHLYGAGIQFKVKELRFRF